MKWVEGRQHTGYYKLPLFIISKFDSYILKYKPGSYIPEHIDLIKGYKHFRINIEIISAKQGGEFKCNKIIFKLWKLIIFRPDENIHSINKVISGTKYVLSIGWIIKQKGKHE